MAGKRVGLISHLAAVDSQGCSSAQRLQERRGVELVCLMGPEHGYFGRCGAGESCRAGRHPDWKIPIHSLYGEQRRPSRRVLAGLDAVVVDLQDLGMRPYTYVSTLRLTLEEAAATGTTVIVADRPVPLPRTVDGPLLDPAFTSFVSGIPAPMVYGMTPGETARWLQSTCIPELDLHVAAMQGYSRNLARATDWPPFLRPSPAIVSWESAMCYPATVCLEGITSLDHGRATDMPFQLVGAPWIKGQQLCEALAAYKLPGVACYPHRYLSRRPDFSANTALSGIRLVVSNPARYQPIRTGVTLLHCLQTLYGRQKLWTPRHCRADFFDKLMGCSTVRHALQDGSTPSNIATQWKLPTRAFRRQRAKHLLYGAAST